MKTETAARSSSAGLSPPGRRQPKDEEIPKIETNGHAAGLCMTCNNSETCAYRDLRGFDAISCDMFSDYAKASRTTGPRNLEVVLEPAGGPVGDELASQFKGLCQDCGNREACSYSKPDGGVWHCEEYC